MCLFLLFETSCEYRIFPYSENSWKEVVNNRLPREIGKRNFHPRFNSWSILILGKVHLVVIGMNKNKYVLVNVINIPIVAPKTPPSLFISKNSETYMSGIKIFQPPK